MATPVLFISHGPGPLWLLDGKPSDQLLLQQDKNSNPARFLRQLWPTLDIPKPRAVLVVSAHWEEADHTVSTAANPQLYYDYYNFPKEAYHLKWRPPGAPDVARRAKELLQAAGITCHEDDKRGLDHGVFIPTMHLFPEADIPVCEISLKKSMRIDDHISLGLALAPLRREGIFILGSGHTTHYSDMVGKETPEWASRFQSWINNVVCSHSLSREDRQKKLLGSQQEATLHKAHPRLDHYLPLVVCVAAAGFNPGQCLFEEFIYNSLLVSHYRFD